LYDGAIDDTVLIILSRVLPVFSHHFSISLAKRDRGFDLNRFAYLKIGDGFERLHDRARALEPAGVDDDGGFDGR
jgi:hypothetical protein